MIFELTILLPSLPKFWSTPLPPVYLELGIKLRASWNTLTNPHQLSSTLSSQTSLYIQLLIARKVLERKLLGQTLSTVKGCRVYGWTYPPECNIHRLEM